MRASILVVLAVAPAAYAGSHDAPAPTVAAVAAAGEPVATSVAVAPPVRETQRRGLAIGAELGEPTSATVGYFMGKLAVLGAVGTGTFEGMGFEARADVQYDLLQLPYKLTLAAGGGLRVYHHGYAPASIDEIPDTHFGVRAALSLARDEGQLRLYAEIAPGVDVAKSTSCNLVSGASSICPHAQDSPLFFQFAVGIRLFLGH